MKRLCLLDVLTASTIQLSRIFVTKTLVTKSKYKISYLFVSGISIFMTLCDYCESNHRHFNTNHSTFKWPHVQILAGNDIEYIE